LDLETVYSSQSKALDSPEKYGIIEKHVPATNDSLTKLKCLSPASNLHCNIIMLHVHQFTLIKSMHEKSDGLKGDILSANISTKSKR